MIKARLVLTPGDPDGIGPEVAWKAIQSGNYLKKGIGILCLGARRPFEKLKARMIEVSESDIDSQSLDDIFRQEKKRSAKPFIVFMSAPNTPPESNLLLEGFQCGWSIQKAVELIQKNAVSALVTGPINKDRLQRGGYVYPGHTEFLADLCSEVLSKDQEKFHTEYLTNSHHTRKGMPEVTMMLANSQLRVSLVTTHLSIKQVPEAITREKIRRAVLHTADGLKQYWGIENPKIAVAALNPHAGEAGLFGKEEIDIIQPEISHLQQYYLNKMEIIGPLPADTLFAKHINHSKKKKWDAVVCMYHDQGLIPVKLLDFHKTVNITLGLPIVRTSVDHGVGYDIVGQGIADASSLMAAIDLAAQIVQKKLVKYKKKLRL